MGGRAQCLLKEACEKGEGVVKTVDNIVEKSNFMFIRGNYLFISGGLLV